jgi:hypothetical protein
MRREKNINNTPVYPASAIAKHNHEWSAEDDLLLIANVESTSDFSALERCVTFSQRFTAFQIRSRWQALLEDPNTVKISERAVRRLSRDEVITKQLYNRLQVLPSREELATISKIPSTIQIYNKSSKQNNLYRNGASSLSLSFLQHFEKNHRKFHIWSQLRWYNLLKNQKVDILSQHKKQESKTISKLIDGSSSENEDDNPDFKNPDHLHTMSAIENGHILQNQSLIRQARKLLNDPQYDTIQSSSSRLNRKTVENMNNLKKSINVQKLPTDVMGVLEGRFMNYNIKSSHSSCGFFNIEETKENQLNLSLELDLLEIPEIYFEITHEYDSGKRMLPRFFLRNVTLPDADFSILVTTANDVYCLLDGETVELENYSMITILNLNFILHINPMFKPSPKSIKFGTQGVKIEDHASSVESGKVRISPPYMDDPCVISGQIYPPTSSAMQPLSVGQIVDIRGYNIQTSSLDGSQSTQPIVETGVTMSPDEEEFENSDDENRHYENFARQQIRPQPRIEIITPMSIPSPGYIPSPHPSSRSFGNNSAGNNSAGNNSVGNNSVGNNSAQKSDKNGTDLNSTMNSTETDKNEKDIKCKLDFDIPERLELPFSPTANPHDDSGDLIIDFSE